MKNTTLATLVLTALIATTHSAVANESFAPTQREIADERLKDALAIQDAANDRLALGLIGHTVNGSSAYNYGYREVEIRCGVVPAFAISPRQRERDLQHRRWWVGCRGAVLREVAVLAKHRP